MNKQKGFTIIELIVVIAIIAVLAGIVLVNVTQYINKGRNAAIQGNMTTLLTNSVVYFDNPLNSSKYGADFLSDSTGLGTNSAILTQIKAANGNVAPTINGDSSMGTKTQAWCASSPTLAAGTTAASTFCVDSSGYKGTLASGKCAGTTYTCQ